MLHCDTHEHNKFCITPQLNPGLSHLHRMVAKVTESRRSAGMTRPVFLSYNTDDKSIRRMP